MRAAQAADGAPGLNHTWRARETIALPIVVTTSTRIATAASAYAARAPSW